MTTSYFKRLRMEISLRRARLPEPTLPDGYAWNEWHPVLTDPHAEALSESFQGEVDSLLFPALATLAGSRRLISDISLRRGFMRQATWLITTDDDGFGEPHPVASIQGAHTGWRRGSIQNVGVIREHRGMGLGRALLFQSLRGFRDRGIRRVSLEVTADNLPAVALYSRIGFRHRRTLYKAVCAAEATPSEMAHEDAMIVAAS